MKNSFKISLIVILLILLVAIAIAFFVLKSDKEPVVLPDNVTPSTSYNITFNLELDALTLGHYEGWAIFGEEKLSTGKFNIGDQLVFQSTRDLSLADKIVVTIEPEGDVDHVPSGIVVLAGDLSGNSANLSFPMDFSQATGNYILATPTNGDESDEVSGVWFLKLPPPPNAGLSLPAVPAGWKYEGWAVNGGRPISTGRFTSVEGSDEFAGYSGSQDAPPFPGEDFLLNAPAGLSFPINLADGASKIVISVEPDLEGFDPTGPGPFQAKPLVADVPADANDHENYGMTLNLGSLPTGTALISK